MKPLNTLSGCRLLTKRRRRKSLATSRSLRFKFIFYLFCHLSKSQGNGRPDNNNKNIEKKSYLPSFILKIGAQLMMFLAIG